MKPEYFVTIDMMQFLKTGKFDCIEPGQDKQWILNNFPDPDGLAREEALKKRKNDIWQYGDFEFHFSHDQLQMVYADYWRCLDGGGHIRLMHWMTDQPVTLHQMMQALNRERMDFSVRTLTKTACVCLSLPASGVELGFSDVSQNPQHTDSNGWQLLSLAWRGRV